MKKWIRRKWMRMVHVILVCAVLIGGLATTAGPVAHADDPCTSVLQENDDSDAVEYLICKPPGDAWNGDLVVYAHGYVSPYRDIEIPMDQLCLPVGTYNDETGCPEGSTYLPELVMSLGYGFATTSYSMNGLVKPQTGISELKEAVNVFSSQYAATPVRVYLVGASMGGWLTAKAAEEVVEEDPVFDGALAACGPIGDFREMINYWGDFRVLFDYFFPGVLPESPVMIPQEVIDNWGPDSENGYKEAIEDALRDRPWKTRQLRRVAGLPINLADPDAVIDDMVQLLWYNVFATNDGTDKLGYQPYDNSDRVYRGSWNDWRLNRGVERFQVIPPDPDPIETKYQTSGDLKIPVVTLHTVRDAIIPYGHETTFADKVQDSGKESLHTNIPVLFRYGHCNFSVVNVLVAFAVLRLKVEGSDLEGIEHVLPNEQDIEEYQELVRPYKKSP